MLSAAAGGLFLGAGLFPLIGSAPEQFGITVLAGSGSLTVYGIDRFAASAAFGGAGLLIASVVLPVTATAAAAAFEGTGSLTDQAIILAAGQSAFKAVGTLFAGDLAGIAIFNASGNLLVGPVLDLASALELEGIGSLTGGVTESLGAGGPFKASGIFIAFADVKIAFNYLAAMPLWRMRRRD